jgi:hypothetical protein
MYSLSGILPCLKNGQAGNAGTKPNFHGFFGLESPHYGIELQGFIQVNLVKKSDL